MVGFKRSLLGAFARVVPALTATARGCRLDFEDRGERALKGVPGSWREIGFLGDCTAEPPSEVETFVVQ